MRTIKTKDFFDPAYLATELHNLSNRSYENGSPWNIDQFAEDLFNQQSQYLILEEEGIVGFLSYHQFLDECEIFNLAIHPNYQKKGYGALLLQKLIQTAVEEQIVQIMLEVRVTNFSAQHLYINQGFEVIARRKNYYHSPTEDALIMMKKVRPE
ncbi:ribosomal protein S18-alanine N-acetyltransferase [Enterococcus saccharolyticus]|uniref:[Ribosomal protein bS18]-alanine N-acetyltransferase n=1 Tax=Candidatus Enterococcus willemsii TaxID=1857215 RepID=A0ABQ6YVK1_9ENTE|nr:MULTISPECIES: ribosomal protein S18-alanine N-acetyltransferase [Enterococcus]KAF1301112.1 ribosomal-protein-alanine N-acetyltransferase [Enterococcus sp. CU12B]MCD5001081.1 ribosomal protein S18-alanine N-acetyltransferase [Enterococcus saccharolyticus]